MRLVGAINSGAAVGGNGAAVANANSSTSILGVVIGVYVRYNHTCPVTTDVIVKTVGGTGAMPSTTFLTLTDKNTDGLFLPRAIPQDTVGANLAALTIAEPIAIADAVNVSIAGANALDSVDVWLLLQD